MYKITLLTCICLVFLASCKDDKKTADTQDTQTGVVKAKKRAMVPPVSGDSVYQFVEKQLSFGTRVPGSSGHKAQKDWMVAKAKSYGLDVRVQEFTVDFLGKKNVPAYNIIASLNPDHKDRVILAAHWDTRLIAEKDPDPSKQKTPIMGAVDGGGGVAALFEIMRVLSEKNIDLGVDFILFDAEDQGNEGAGWCLGAQYWAKNPHVKEYKADWGILLDLIGAKDARFYKEDISMVFAGNYVNKVWNLAQNMGFGKYFISERIGSIEDDHYYVNTIAKIPMINIIHTMPSGNFAAYHHTHKDDLPVIDKEVLRVVTQVTIAALYRYSDGSL